MRLVSLLSLVCLFSASNFAVAQNLIFGSLTGTLTDSAGASVPQASVTLINEGTDDSRHVVTDSSGFYQFLNLQPAATGSRPKRPASSAPFAPASRSW